MKMQEIVRKFEGKYVAHDVETDDFSRGEMDMYRNLASLISPVAVLEVGVWRGYSAASIIVGAARSLEEYTGIDAELYCSDSNACAVSMIRQATELTGSQASYSVIKHDTQTDGVPDDVKLSKFDWVHIDAGHETVEAVKDIVNFWPLVNRVMTVHDVQAWPSVTKAVESLKDSDQMPGCTGYIDIPSVSGFRLYLKA